MKALALEKKGSLSLREFDLPLAVGDNDVKVAIHTVGICGSDVHYYTHGRIGAFVVREPMVLGHEASGTVVEVGAEVTNLKVGDRVCMEPGIPDPDRRRPGSACTMSIRRCVLGDAADPWLLTPFVVHPAAFTFKLPDNVSFAEGAMVEPFAVGMQAATKARIKPGDVAVVNRRRPDRHDGGAGGAGRRLQPGDHLRSGAAEARRSPRAIRALPRSTSASNRCWRRSSGGRGGGAPTSCSRPAAAQGLRRTFSTWCVRAAAWCWWACRSSRWRSISVACAKEIRIETVFRYANIFPRALELIACAKVDLKPLISGTYSFDKSVAAFERAAAGNPGDIELHICVAPYKSARGLECREIGAVEAIDGLLIE